MFLLSGGFRTRMEGIFFMERYSVICEKNKREIVLLRGSGCRWRRCRFCDYHLDSSTCEEENARINSDALAQVTGCFRRLEVINSGSFPELPVQTVEEIERVCAEKGIYDLHTEFHYLWREEIAPLKERMGKRGIRVTVKTGIETFDYLFRESYLDKGIPNVPPEELARDFDEVCLLFGLPGQTAESMRRDVETGLRYFQRVCVNIMQRNSAKIYPDASVIETFMKELYPVWREDGRVDILLENTDFGVGEMKGDEQNVK